MSETNEKPGTDELISEELDELGIDTVREAFIKLVDSGIHPAIEAVDCSQILVRIEKVVQLIIPQEEERKDFDAFAIEQEAATWVADQMVGNMCFRVQSLLVKNAEQITSTAANLRAACAKQKALGTVADWVISRASWLTRMKCQREYLLALEPHTNAAYKRLTGKDYVFPTGASEPAVDDILGNALNELTG